MRRVVSLAEAVAASVRCARAVGLPTGDPHVVAEGYSVRVHLRPAPVVSRVVTAGRVLRSPVLPWMQREVAVGQYLVTRGAPVVGPWTDPGPHLVDDVEVSLWHWVQQVPGTVSAAAYGPLLHALHEALAPCPVPLPLLAGPLNDITTALASYDDPVLHAAADALLPLTASWSRRPLHGDAHTGNVLLTRQGPLWTDFEDVCVGPVEWDLASLTVSDEAVTAYPATLDRTLLDDCRDLRRLQILANLLADQQDDAGSRALYDTLTAALRARADR